MPIKISYFTHRDLIKEARNKYPGLNLFVTLALYNNLLATIYKHTDCFSKRASIAEKIQLCMMLITALDRFSQPQGRN